MEVGLGKTLVRGPGRLRGKPPSRFPEYKVAVGAVFWPREPQRSKPYPLPLLSGKLVALPPPSTALHPQGPEWGWEASDAF